MKKFFMWVGTLYIGMVGGVLFFADFSAGETLATRSATALILALFAGLIIGFVYPKKYWLAIIAAWLPILFIGIAIIHTFTNPGTIDISQWLSVVPIAGSLVGGYIGSYLKNNNRTQTLYRTLFGLLVSFGIILIYVNFASHA